MAEFSSLPQMETSKKEVGTGKKLLDSGEKKDGRSGPAVLQLAPLVEEKEKKMDKTEEYKLAWFDLLSAPITLLWFLALTYLLMISLVKFLLVPKGEAKQPFMLCGEKVHSEREKIPLEQQK